MLFLQCVSNCCAPCTRCTPLELLCRLDHSVPQTLASGYLVFLTHSLANIVIFSKYISGNSILEFHGMEIVLRIVSYSCLKRTRDGSVGTMTGIGEWVMCLLIMHIFRDVTLWLRLCSFRSFEGTQWLCLEGKAIHEDSTFQILESRVKPLRYPQMSREVLSFESVLTVWVPTDVLCECNGYQGARLQIVQLRELEHDHSTLRAKVINAWSYTPPNHPRLLRMYRFFW